MTPDRRERAVALGGTVLVHAALGALLLGGLGVRFERTEQPVLNAFEVPLPVPSPSPAQAARDAAPREEGRAAPPALDARPKPVAAPLPPIPLPPPPMVAPRVAADGIESSAGAAPVAGPGTGAGGVGDGLGAGSGGSGTGGGGGGTRATYLSGTITARDWPRAASRAGATGSVTVRYTVTASGRVEGCRVVVSSGRSDLDEATCRLIEQRFRYRPARDAVGRAVAEQRAWRQDWWFAARD